MAYQISALNEHQFSHLFAANDRRLAKSGVKRVVVDKCPGYPCRVSLQDARPGESVLLLNFEHQPAASPFRSSHAIYVREGATQFRPAVNEIPKFLRRRLLSVRAFDVDGFMLDADVVDGERLESSIESLFANDKAYYLHIHNASLGCYLAMVEPQT